MVRSGDAKVMNGHLLLSLDNPNDLSGTTGLEADFVIVRWGQHLFLVPGAEKEDFCNGVNQGGEGLGGPRSNLYCRISKGDHKFTGVPSVPRDWAPLILQKPIEGKVIEVLAGGRARVDLGAESGVWKGMTLQVACTGRSDAVVTDVGPKTCVIATKYDKVELRWPKWSRSDPSASWGAILFKQGERVGSRLRKKD
jgi:hypothetical protein